MKPDQRTGRAGAAGAHDRARAGSARSRRERGAVLAEFLIFVPLILFCGLAAVEIGTAYRDRLTVSSTLRTTARVATNAGNDGSTDWQAVSAFRSSVSDIPLSKVERVVIYKAAANGDPIDAACLTPAVVATRGVAGACNVYSSATIAAATAADFTADGALSCAGKFDAQWCPIGRLTEKDALGVWVRIRHDYATKFLPASVNLSDRVVMRIEPELS